MLRNTRLRLIIAFLILTLAGLYLALFDTPKEGPADRLDDSKRVDFFVRDALITKFNAQGDIEHIIHSPLLQHFPGKELTRLEQPHLIMPGDLGDMQISSDEGFFLDDDSKIELAGNVQVIDNSISEIPWILSTSILTFLPPDNYAETDAAVRITQGRNQTDAVGMQVWFNEHQVDLLSEVRGYYVAN